MRLSPEVAARSCEDCKKYRYKDDEKVGGERIMLATGKPRLRTPGEKPPCSRCPKIPVGVAPFPANAVEVTPQLRATLRHYWECEAVGEFPRDPIVRRNAGIIAATLSEIENEQRLDMGEMMESFVRAAVHFR